MSLSGEHHNTHTHTRDDYYNQGLINYALAICYNHLPIERLIMQVDCILIFEVSINFSSGMIGHLMHDTILSGLYIVTIEVT